MRSLFVAIALIAGCADQAVLVTPVGGGAPQARLSALGLFEGAPALQQPAAGVVPYEVNVSLYSDEAQKHRFLYLPPGTQLHATDDRWQLPVGAMAVKTFYYGAQLVETRILVQRDHGLEHATYVWNDEQTDAFASGGNVDVPTSWIDDTGARRDDHFHVPGTSQCNDCHEDRFLGWRTRQLDRDGQLEAWASAGLVDAIPSLRAPLPDTFGDAPLADRARAYLDVNCSHCHAADGEAHGTHVYFDLDDLVAQEPFCRKAASIDGATRVLVPGDPEHSAFLKHMVANDAVERMPRGPTHLPDRRAIAVLQDWVRSLSPAGCP